MSKPIVFFSHSSRDKDCLAHLKELFVAKTGGAIDVFLSSDGQSIQLGRNWVHRIEEALNDSKLMVVFATPNSLKSNWIFFESGYAYAKGIRVVPVGFLGVDLVSVPPPLSLLQGFNINSEDGLNNVIALANDVFELSHEGSFTDADYQDLVGSIGTLTTSGLGDYTPVIDELSIYLRHQHGMINDVEHTISAIADLLSQKAEVTFQRSANRINLHGASFIGNSNDQAITVKIDPAIAAITLPTVSEILRTIRTNGTRDCLLTVSFYNSVYAIHSHHKMTARLYGTEAKLNDDGRLRFRDVVFKVDDSPRFLGNVTAHSAFVQIEIETDTVPIDQIRELISLLFERGVLLFNVEKD